MLIKTDDHFIKSSEDFEKSTFKIAASAKAFSILSSALYQNKIRAIIRELSCNAIDAQKVSGVSRPFEISLPRSMNPEFRIRDFGTGISPEDIIKVYTTYFESTKTMSNDMIGCLGLGSKTPFCYTDNFMVNSYWGGKKRSYACVIDEQGMPAINHVSEEDTLEPSGLEVSFAVQEKDFSTFSHEMDFVNHFLEVKPDVIPAAKNLQIKILAEGKNKDWKILEPLNQYAYNYQANDAIFRSYIIMGNVPYAIDPSNIPNLTTEESVVLKNRIHIMVPIGSVEPQASREALSFTKSTIAFLQKKIKQIVEEIKEERQTKINSLKSYFEAICYHIQQGGSSIAEPFRTLFKTFDFKGRKVESFVPLFTATTPVNAKTNSSKIREGFEKYTRYSRQATGYGTSIAIRKCDESTISEYQMQSWLNGISSPVKKSTIKKIVFVREGSLATAKSENYAYKIIREWLAENEELEVGSRLFLVPQDVIDNLGLVDGIDVFDFNKLPVLPKPTVVKPPKQKRVGKKKSEVWLVNKSGYGDLIGTSTEEVDFEDVNCNEKVYVEVKNKKVEATSKGGRGIDLWILEFGKIFPDVTSKLYGLTPTQVEEIKTNPKWVEVREAFARKIKEKLTSPDCIKEATNEFRDSFRSSMINIDLYALGDSVLNLLKTKDSNHEIVKLLEDYNQYSKSKNNSSNFSYIKFLDSSVSKQRVELIEDVFGINVDSDIDHLEKIKQEQKDLTDKEKNSFIKRNEDLIKKYPVIKLWTQSSSNKDAVNQIVEKIFCS